MKYIYRLTITHRKQKSITGYNVLIKFSQFFNDNWYGGQVGSLKAAKQLRDRIVKALEKSKVPRKMGRAKKPKIAKRGGNDGKL